MKFLSKILSVIILFTISSFIFANANSNSNSPEFSFALVGDFQLGYSGSYADSNYEKCLEYIKNQKNISFVVTVGDNTQHAADSEYDLLINTKNKYIPEKNMYIAIGNHDRGYVEGYVPSKGYFADYEKKFVNAANELASDLNISKVYYSFIQHDSTFIILGPESVSRNDYCNDVYYSKEEFDWFEEEIKKASESGNPIYVIIHEPFYNTVSGTLSGQNWHGNPNEDIYENNFYLKIKSVTDRYTNAIVFSGHTHWEFKSKQPIYKEKNGATYVNCSSVGYLWNDYNAGYIENGKYSGSEGYIVNVYEDYIELIGVDFLTGENVLTEKINLKTNAAKTDKSGGCSVLLSDNALFLVLLIIYALLIIKKRNTFKLK